MYILYVHMLCAYVHAIYSYLQVVGKDICGEDMFDCNKHITQTTIPVVPTPPAKHTPTASAVSENTGPTAILSTGEPTRPKKTEPAVALATVTEGVVTGPTPILSTAEPTRPKKTEPTVTLATVTEGVVAPAKRGRGNHKPHSVMRFMNEAAYNAFFTCGRSTKQDVSPCVDRSQVSGYPMIFEEWQEHSTGATGPKKWYRCRRQRYRRKKGIPPGTNPPRLIRQAKLKTQYVGCGCQARYRMEVHARHHFI